MVKDDRSRTEIGVVEVAVAHTISLRQIHRLSGGGLRSDDHIRLDYDLPAQRPPPKERLADVRFVDARFDDSQPFCHPIPAGRAGNWSDLTFPNILIVDAEWSRLG